MRRLRLFVYGTLQPGAGTDMARWLDARSVRTRPAVVPGRLFGLSSRDGWYPALVPGQAAVRGTLCDLALAWGDLARLDGYEGREYSRVALPVRTDEGERTRAQTYLWRIAMPAGAPLIMDGDFIAWLRRNRGRAFAPPRGTA